MVSLIFVFFICKALPITSVYELCFINKLALYLALLKPDSSQLAPITFNDNKNKIRTKRYTNKNDLSRSTLLNVGIKSKEFPCELPSLGPPFRACAGSLSRANPQWALVKSLSTGPNGGTLSQPHNGPQGHYTCSHVLVDNESMCRIYGNSMTLPI